MKHALSNDDALQQAVVAALRAIGLAPSVIDVAVRGAIVTLRGHVENAAQKHAAQSEALQVDGVLALVVAVEIRNAGSRRMRDDQIAAEVLTRLAWDGRVPPGAIQVQIEQGWVTLLGELERGEQKAAALESVSRLFGVAGVTDLTTIRVEAAERAATTAATVRTVTTATTATTGTDMATAPNRDAAGEQAP
jgi:osmotically-inducible protein OsmY